MSFWERVKKDVPKSFREGVEVVRLRASQLTTEGRKQIKLFDLKNKVHKEMADLGGAVYSSKQANPMDDPQVKKIITRVKKLESQVNKLEKPSRAPKKKKAAAKKKTARKKKAAKKKTAA
jgi:outer membrane murein-binding lipoprotein Lpp